MWKQNKIDICLGDIFFPIWHQKYHLKFTQLCVSIMCQYVSDNKESACSTGDWDSVPGSGRSLEKGMATCHGLHRLGPGDGSGWEEGCRGPKSWVKQGYFICRNACLYIFNKMITQPLKRMKFHQLQQNGDS